VSLLAGAIALPALLGPAHAGAYAQIAPAPSYSNAPGLPDSRVYERVSPGADNGGDAGASTNQTLEFGGLAHYALASADGDALLFEASGPLGETANGYTSFFVAQRSAGGWSTRAVLPSALEERAASKGTISVQPFYLDPSTDLSHAMFQSEEGFFAPPPFPKCTSSNLYLAGPEPAAPAIWLARPQIEDPVENCAPAPESIVPVGGTPNFSTVYFAYPGTLLPEDAARAPHAQGEGEEHKNVEAWGLYEYTGGTLKEAATLPDGKLDPFGAVPANSGHNRTTAGNQVADEGTRLFFVSPDPASCGRENNCATDPPELYVRENGERSLLVSRDTLLPSVEGLPAAAPDGVVGTTRENRGFANPSTVTSYVYASPDGSQAFFQSEDDLTQAAQELAPGAGVKTYDFEVQTGALTYLPDVEGQIVSSSADGSSFTFIRPEAKGEPAELDMWSASASGGTVTPITQLPGTPADGHPDVPVARTSNAGSAVVFTTTLTLPGGFNSGSELEQVYRYEATTNTLSCLSCAPAGVTPTGNAELAPLQANEENEEALNGRVGMVEERGISADGGRVFFDTPTPLTPDADNAGLVENYRGELVPGGRDVYEWENGTVYLLSSGKSPQNSYFLDNSENGDDVFFATAEGLLPGQDTDEAYAVYDARVPQPGERVSSSPSACQDSQCQGPAPTSPALELPASATFSGPGNLAPSGGVSVATPTKPPSKPLTRAQKLARALRICKKKRGKTRHSCEAQARRRYGTQRSASPRKRGSR